MTAEIVGQGATSSKTATNNNKEQSESAETFAESTVEGCSSVELLLCLRPIRDGDEKVDEKLRFVPGASRRQIVSESSSGPGSGQGSGEASGPSSDENQQEQQQRFSKPSKKRVLSKSELPSKKRRRGEAKQGDTGKVPSEAVSVQKR